MIFNPPCIEKVYVFFYYRLEIINFIHFSWVFDSALIFHLLSDNDIYLFVNPVNISPNKFFLKCQKKKFFYFFLLISSSIYRINLSKKYSFSINNISDQKYSLDLSDTRNTRFAGS